MCTLPLPGPFRAVHGVPVLAKGQNNGSDKVIFRVCIFKKRRVTKPQRTFLQAPLEKLSLSRV